MSEDDEEETNDEWQEYWLMVGGVSEKATEAIESVGGKVVLMMPQYDHSPKIYGVCLLYEDHDDDYGITWHTDDGQKTREIFVSSPDAHHSLYIHCADDSVPQFESDVTELRIVTEGEWFAIADADISDDPVQ